MIKWCGKRRMETIRSKKIRLYSEYEVCFSHLYFDIYQWHRISYLIWIFSEKNYTNVILTIPIVVMSLSRIMNIVVTPFFIPIWLRVLLMIFALIHFYLTLLSAYQISCDLSRRHNSHPFSVCTSDFHHGSILEMNDLIFFFLVSRPSFWLRTFPSFFHGSNRFAINLDFVFAF